LWVVVQRCCRVNDFEWIHQRATRIHPLKGSKFLSDELGRGARRSFDSNVTIWILNYCYAYTGHHPRPPLGPWLLAARITLFRPISSVSLLPLILGSLDKLSCALLAFCLTAIENSRDLLFKQWCRQILFENKKSPSTIVLFMYILKRVMKFKFDIDNIIF